jgi:glucan biosynthesis protein C
MLSLQHRRPKAIMRERAARLLVPLVFGMLVIVPPQVYFGRLQQGKFHGSYLDYFPQAFNGVYPNGNLTWNHLWFIPYVLVLTGATLPLFDWLRMSAARPRIKIVMTAAAKFHLYWALLVPLVLANLLLRGQETDAHTFVDDAHGWIEFGSFFLLGGAFAEWPAVLKAVQCTRFISLGLAIGAYAALRLIWPSIGENPDALPPAQAIAWCCVSAVNVLGWVLAVVGLLTKHFNRASPTLRYFTEAALPVYERWLGLSEQYFRFSKWSVCRLMWCLPLSGCCAGRA